MSHAVLDDALVHRRFAAECFNHAWTLLDKTPRSTAEEEELVHCAHASAWHWSRRADETPSNRAIAAWQLARVYAAVGRADEARRYGGQSLDICRESSLDAFLTAYAFEALARAEAVAGNAASRDRWLNEARELANAVADADGRRQLQNDLDTIR